MAASTESNARMRDDHEPSGELARENRALRIVREPGAASSTLSPTDAAIGIGHLLVEVGDTARDRQQRLRGAAP